MYHVKTMNKISKIGLAQLDDRFEISDTMEHEDAILVRSAKLHDYDFPAELLCIARAGAGVNNIPLDRAADAGIVVFNTPGANANAVKELAVCALLLASRGIVDGINWAKAVEDRAREDRHDDLRQRKCRNIDGIEQVRARVIQYEQAQREAGHRIAQH